jgi:CheY-like chemotaxis protein
MLDEDRNKILLVEDRPNARRLYQTDLESAGYWVLSTDRFLTRDNPGWEEDLTPESAEELIEAHFFHAAVIDLSLSREKMNDRSGIEILHRIMELRENTKCVILTGLATPQEVRGLLKTRGAYDFLDKEFYSRSVINEVVSGAVKAANTAATGWLDDNSSYYALVREPTLQEVRDRIGIGSSQEIRDVVESTLLPYRPFDRRRSTVFEDVTVGAAGHKVLTLVVWSRYLGSAIRIRVGSREVCDFHRLALQSLGKRLDRDYRLVEASPKDRVVALVEWQPQVTLDSPDLVDVRSAEE